MNVDVLVMFVSLSRSCFSSSCRRAIFRRDVRAARRGVRESVIKLGIENGGERRVRSWKVWRRCWRIEVEEIDIEWDGLWDDLGGWG